MSASHRRRPPRTANGPAAVGPALAEARYLVPYLLNRVNARVQQRWRIELGTGGPTLPQWQVLSILSAADGMRVGAIATMAGVDQPVMSRVIDQMERDGTVRRAPAADDNRAVEVWLTAAGRKAFARLVPRAEKFVDHLLDGIDPADVDTLHRTLAQLLAILEEDQP